MGLYTIRDFQEGGILSEAYVPKSKYLKKAEELLDKLRQPYLIKDTSGITGLGKINASRFNSAVENLQGNREWVEFEKCLEKQFGFQTFTVNIFRSSIPNAFTLPVSIDITHLADFSDVLDTNGLKYRESANINGISFISDGLLFNGKLSSGQILAVILHEIGHNFTQMAIEVVAKINAGKVLLGGTIGILSLFLKLDGLLGTNLSLAQKLGMIAGLFANDSVKNKINTVRRSDSALNQALDIGISVMSLNSDVAMLINDLLRIKGTLIGVFRNKIISHFKGKALAQMDNLKGNYKSAIVAQIANYSAFMDESFADKFVAMNGYGVEFATGMKVFEAEAHSFGIRGTIDKVPVIGQIFALDYIMSATFNTIMTGEPHPALASRLNTQIDILEEELKRPGISNRTRELIKKDIKDIREKTNDLDKLMKKDINFKSSQYKYYILSFNELITKIQPKGDIRELFMSKVKDNKSIMDTLEKNAKKAEELANKLNKKFR